EKRAALVRVIPESRRFVKIGRAACREIAVGHRVNNRRGPTFPTPQPAVPSRQCSGLLPLKFSPTSHPAPLPSWDNGANVIWLTPVPFPGSGTGGVSARANLAAPGCSGQLVGRRQCFRLAVLAWRRGEAGAGQFPAEHD